MTVIKVENLGKKYLIGHDKKAGGVFQYNSMRDSIAHSFRGMYQRLRHPLSPNIENTELEEFWALKDINFEIKQGDRVGIIGHNGAGKTTLLKLLSRITQPSTGSIKIKGRIASLLEVGTGFHPELSGRENIYLNGAILGMKRVEIKKKFDEIVAFAEVEKFLDTPVKRYSSGMYVRLAFAVAAHLDPEILIVDEVLAVGDAEFQKKSIGKMKDVSKEGRTIVFVSHNMVAIQNLCNTGLLLEESKIKISGSVNNVVNFYMNQIRPFKKNALWKNNNKFENIFFTPIELSLINKTNELSTVEQYKVKLIFTIEKVTSSLYFDLNFYNNNIPLFTASPIEEILNYRAKLGLNVLIFTLPANLFNLSEYRIDLRAFLTNGTRIIETDTPETPRIFVKYIKSKKYHRPWSNDRRILNPFFNIKS